MDARLTLHRATASLVAALVAAVALAACGDQSRSRDAEALARDPQRLVAVLRQCRADPLWSDEKLCRAASEAWRRRFFDHDRTRASPSSNPQLPATPAPSATEPTPWMAGS
ncbi:MAG: EexN family lipoprotein [Candidatus Eremiobacteraeota bacterium]|nr:EexN family lipoprotein [Candidatus Eremiobacteraeota bacterium]